MMADEMRVNLMGVLQESVRNWRTISPDPHPVERARLETAVLTAKCCCIAAGIDENTVAESMMSAR